MAGRAQAGDDLAPDVAGSERPREARPPEGDDAFGERELGTKAAKVFVSFLNGGNRADDADEGSLGFRRPEVEEQALSYGNEAEDDHVGGTDGRGDVVSVNRVIVIHR